LPKHRRVDSRGKGVGSTSAPVAGWFDQAPV